jgi:hypothetical protein
MTCSQPSSTSSSRRRRVLDSTSTGGPRRPVREAERLDTVSPQQAVVARAPSVAEVDEPHAVRLGGADTPPPAARAGTFRRRRAR